MFLFSLITFILIFNYLDPYQYKVLWLTSIIFTFILGLTSFLTLIIYFLKKIYYRWRVYVFHVLTSFRQSFLLTLFILSLIIFNNIWVPMIITGLLMFIIFTFLELFIQNLETN